MRMTLTWPDAKNVLCIRLDNMGDVLMTTPALRALKCSAPGRQLTLLTSPSGALLEPYLPDVDRVMAYDAPWVKNTSNDVIADEGIIRTVRDEAFDAAVIFTVYSQSPLAAALVCRLAGIPLTLAHCRENPYLLVSHWVREPEPGRLRHEARRQLDLVAEVGAFNPDPRMRFITRAGDRCNLYAKLAHVGLTSGDRWIVAHCGATAPSRRYPPESFARAFQYIGRRAGLIVLTGDRTEQDLVRHIHKMSGQEAPLIDLAGELSLGELACLIEDAALLLSNNTGPVHIAAAVGTPVVDLYALTNPQHTPWMVPHRVLYHDVPCKYCYRSVCPEKHHACLRGVAPEAVGDAVLDVLTRPRQPSSARVFELSEQEGTAC